MFIHVFKILKVRLIWNKKIHKNKKAIYQVVSLEVTLRVFSAKEALKLVR